MGFLSFRVTGICNCHRMKSGLHSVKVNSSWWGHTESQDAHSHNFEFLTFIFLDHGWSTSTQRESTQIREGNHNLQWSYSQNHCNPWEPPPLPVCFILPLNHADIKHPFLTNATLCVGLEMHYTAQQKVLTFQTILSTNFSISRTPPPPLRLHTPPPAPLPPSTFLPMGASPAPFGSLHLFSCLPLFSHYIYICYIWWLGSFSLLCFMKHRPLWHMYTELFGALSQTSESSCFIPVSVFNLLHPGRPATSPAIHHIGLGEVGCGLVGRVFNVETEKQSICRHL